MDTWDAIFSRKTIRDFDEREIPIDTARRLIRAGLAAPSNDHLRRWEFILVRDKEKREALVRSIGAPRDVEGAVEIVNRWGLSEPSQREMYIDAIPKQHAMLLNAGCLIVPCFFSPGALLKPETLSSLNSFASVWCCIENILIAAASEGIFGVTRIPFEKERVTLKEVLSIPENYEVPCYLALGYPHEDAKRAKQYAADPDEKIHLNRW